jgi:hypothetical protein
MEIGRRGAGGREDGVDEGLAPSVTPFGDVPDRSRGICEKRFEISAFGVTEGCPQQTTSKKAGVTNCADQSSDGSSALFIPPRVLPVIICVTFVEQSVRCEAERVVQFVCCDVDVGGRMYGQDRDIVDERGPLVVFRIIYNPPLARGGMGVGTGKGE